MTVACHAKQKTFKNLCKTNIFDFAMFAAPMQSPTHDSQMHIKPFKINRFSLLLQLDCDHSPGDYDCDTAKMILKPI